MKTLPEQIAELLPNLNAINNAEEMESNKKEFRALANCFQALANYAEVKRDAITLRKKGEINLALQYEKAADVIWSRMPPWAKW